VVYQFHVGFWILLLTISLGAAAVVYEIWLKGHVLREAGHEKE